MPDLQQPHTEGKSEQLPRSLPTILLGISEVSLGILVLYWQFTIGVYDESSLGTVVFLWGSLAALFGLVLPGGLLLFGSRAFWGCQLVPLVLALLVASRYLGFR